ncbi:MAG: hypothetical protein QM778_22470 [Myxococcales bacterium]
MSSVRRGSSVAIACIARTAGLVGPLLLSSCRHDVDALQEQHGHWLPETAGEACDDCVATSCSSAEQACAEDPRCFQTFKTCYPPTPACGVYSPIHRAFANCTISQCYEACALREHELSCLGRYHWPDPDSKAPTHFTASLSAFKDGNFRAATLEVCFSPSQPCEPSVAVSEPVPVSLSYRWSLGSKARPYVRVTGAEVQELLYFEGAPIVENYELSVSVLGKDEYTSMLAVLGGLSIDPGLGTLSAVMLGCSAARLPDVEFRLYRGGAEVSDDADGVPYTIPGSFPVPVSEGSTTQNAALGGFANIPPGTYSVLAFREGTLIGRSDDLLVVGGVVTHTNIMPLSDSQSSK